jgi:cold shock CspA family protein
LSVNKQGAGDLALAIREAFDSTRRLEDHLRELRRDVKAHALPLIASIAGFFTGVGYGFLETSDNREVHFHCNSVLEGHFDDLKPGTRVSFAEEQGEKGPRRAPMQAKRWH